MVQQWEPRVAISDLEDFCLQIGMGRKARLFLRPGLTPRQYLGRLLVHGIISEGIRFQAHTLTKREAVWWACLCLRSVNDPMRKPKQAAALKAAVRWVLDPSEPNRLAAGAAGKAASFSTSVGCIAMSVFWSGGGLDPLLTANTLAVTIAAASAEGDLEEINVNMKRFLALGISIAKGQYLWTPNEDDKDRAASKH